VVSPGAAVTICTWKLLLVAYVAPALLAGSLQTARKFVEHMGLTAEAQRLEAAVGRVYRDGKVLTPDQGGSARTRDMAQAVLAAYR